MRVGLHDLVGVAGLLCLAALAWLLWDDEPKTVAVREAFMGPEPPRVEPKAKPLSRVKTYDFARTTIPPLISDKAIAQRRAQ